jgi:hypothetical protein
MSRSQNFLEFKQHTTFITHIIFSWKYGKNFFSNSSPSYRTQAEHAQYKYLLENLKLWIGVVLYLGRPQYGIFVMQQVTHFVTWSEMVNLTAVTTVVLIRADSDTSDSCNLGNKLAGSIRVSFPRHSATTFRVPSSPHSQWRNNCCQIAGTNGWSNCTPPGVKDWHDIICNTISTLL